MLRSPSLSLEKGKLLWDTRWDRDCICLYKVGATHVWYAEEGRCLLCGTTWEDRHYDVDGICVMCGAGDFDCWQPYQDAETGEWITGKPL